MRTFERLTKSLPPPNAKLPERARKGRVRTFIAYSIAGVHCMLMEPAKTFLRSAGVYFLYAFTIFLGAFLLFAVQPIMGKYLLPFFGGSSSVWAISLLFFTGVLFVGYAYVQALSRLEPRRQALVHGVISFTLVVLTLGAIFLIWQSVFPALDWIADSSFGPAMNVLLALLVAVGAPYFLLSTTGPLLQYWWGLTVRSEPYKLYALSNAGSLLALLCYPFLIEPLVRLRVQQGMWETLFIVYALLIAYICVHFARSDVHAHVSSETSTVKSTTWLAWIGLAALPSAMLVATTVFITQVVAPVPLLWVVPLAIYLLTFIIAFAGYGASRFLPLLVLGASFAAYQFASFDPTQVLKQVIIYLALLFLIGLFCHGLLYTGRPSTSKLPFFYLLISLGGVIGTFCVGLIAPMVFSDYLEFHIGLAISAILSVALLSPEFFPRILSDSKILIARVAFICFILGLLLPLLSRSGDVPFVAERNFYGVTKVEFLDGINTLMHGTTLHGIEPTSREWRGSPSSYYVLGSGLGRAMLFEQGEREAEGMQVAVMGLGSGSISSYCRDKDAYVFFEIDPDMERIARERFNYLARCKNSEVHIGDGRMLLAEELKSGNAEKYDLIVMDAFSDDSIPTHLVTLEAVRMYAEHLRSSRSIIAIHASNRYIYLPNVILRIAKELRMDATIILDDGAASTLGSPSMWVLLTKDHSVFDSLVFASTSPWIARDVPLWTDDYTSLFSVVDFGLVRFFMRAQAQ